MIDFRDHDQCEHGSPDLIPADPRDVERIRLAMELLNPERYAEARAFAAADERMGMVKREKPTFEVTIFDDHWWWDLILPNGEIIAQCRHAGYKTKRNCLRAIDRVLIAIFDGEIRVIE